MLLSVFFCCIRAFLCAVAVSNYPFVVKAMLLVGFPPKRPFPPHQIVSVLAKRDDIFGRRDLVISAGPILLWTVTKDWAQNSRNFTLQSVLQCFASSRVWQSHSLSLISLSHSGLRKKRGYSLTRQRVIFLNRSVIKWVLSFSVRFSIHELVTVRKGCSWLFRPM